jgi:Zn-dependent protease with chaperone function
MDGNAARGIAAQYFDGISARAHGVRADLCGGQLQVRGAGIAVSVPARQVKWPERTRHGTRVAHLPGGAVLHCADREAWDAWLMAAGRGEALVVKAQQSWRATWVSVVLLVTVLAAGFVWGVPWAVRAAVAVLPVRIDAVVGQAALESLEGHLLDATQLPPPERERIVAAFERAVAAMPAGSVPAWRIEFRKSRIGPNAFALPGGTIVMTDELVRLVRGDERILVGVLAHELGHVRHRHGMRALAQVSALGAAAGLVLGDFSSLLASVPVWLGQAAYSRDAEREADLEAVRVLKAAGHSPEVMVEFFKSVRQGEDGKPQDEGARESWLGIAIASHPADEERMQFFRDAAR